MKPVRRKPSRVSVRVYAREGSDSGSAMAGDTLEVPGTMRQPAGNTTSTLPSKGPVPPDAVTATL